MTTERALWAGLSAIVEPGNRELGQVVRRAGPFVATEALCAERVSEQLVGAAATRLGRPLTVAAVEEFGHRLLADADRLGVRIVCPVDEEWPARFADLIRISRGYTGQVADRDTDPPLALWVRGPHRLDQAFERSVAVVGARAASEYGAYVAGDLAGGLAESGWTVVSGGALGIDGAAHRAALAGGGVTVAVLACGINRPYPVSHTAMFERIGEEGLVVSEWPPDAPPYKLRFLIRNRVIAAASAGTVLVEAAHRSGARQTLGRARLLGRPTLVVPGPVTSAMSVGCHEELRVEGTRAVASVAHVIEEVGRIGVDLAPLPVTPERPHDRLDPMARQVLEGVPMRRPLTAEEIAAAAGVSGRDARRSLPLLVTLGHVEVIDDGYRLARPA
ncbi:DNA-processing protein DprA [Virgisporangium ochraceum]|uniref:DNA protecting protein DprA n=1 Tax=Virgisporangium ochraceum TaxID=65505 RepID=A0A8J4E7J6_9ACTN|nr:DNA-processing protein DprA [Virgisporangium ochraceum]GIJ65170.1 DNA protecting protein DprA [Virgisporangium ochraceum]